MMEQKLQDLFINSVSKLVIQIVKAKKAYYLDGKALLSDAAYDKLEADLRVIDPDHPILYAVGYDSTYDWWLKHYEEQVL